MTKIIVPVVTLICATVLVATGHAPVEVFYGIAVGGAAVAPSAIGKG